MEHVFKSKVIHDGKHFEKGQLCPKDLHELMQKRELIHPLPEPVKPVEPKEKADKK